MLLPVNLINRIQPTGFYLIFFMLNIMLKIVESELMGHNIWAIFTHIYYSDVFWKLIHNNRSSRAPLKFISVHCFHKHHFYSSVLDCCYQFWFWFIIPIQLDVSLKFDSKCRSLQISPLRISSTYSFPFFSQFLPNYCPVCSVRHFLAP